MVVVAYRAGFIWLARKRRQMSSYSASWFLSRYAATAQASARAGRADSLVSLLSVSDFGTVKWRFWRQIFFSPACGDILAGLLLGFAGYLSRVRAHIRNQPDCSPLSSTPS